MIALPALGTDLYVPALPEIARALGAPVAAAQLTGALGWPAVLLGVAVVAAVLLASLGSLPETAPAERRSAHPSDIARTFIGILGDRRFVAPFLLILCAQIGVLSWISS